jgi:hypothetical protein
VAQPVVERRLRPLADADDARANRVKGTRELALVCRKDRLYEDDIHGA